MLTLAQSLSPERSLSKVGTPPPHDSYTLHRMVDGNTHTHTHMAYITNYHILNSVACTGYGTYIHFSIVYTTNNIFLVLPVLPVKHLIHQDG